MKRQATPYKTLLAILQKRHASREDFAIGLIHTGFGVALLLAALGVGSFTPYSLMVQLFGLWAWVFFSLFLGIGHIMVSVFSVPKKRAAIKFFQKTSTVYFLLIATFLALNQAEVSGVWTYTVLGLLSASSAKWGR